MDNPINLPGKIGNTSIADLLNKPGTKATVNITENGRKFQIESKQQGYSFYGEIEEFDDGTRREVKTLSPKSTVQSKKPAISELRAKGYTQKQVAKELGISQPSVSRAEKE